MELEKFADEFGPEYVIEICNRKVGLKGILVIPDIVANAGGVISSYAEYRGYNPKKCLNWLRKNKEKTTHV